MADTNREDEDKIRRTRSVNGAFAFLRGLIPTEPLDRKLSKIETLRLATSYIEHLVTQLNNDNDTPCLLLKKNPDGTQRRSVCTFCLSKVKQRSSIEIQSSQADEFPNFSSQPDREPYFSEEPNPYVHSYFSPPPPAPSMMMSMMGSGSYGDGGVY